MPSNYTGNPAAITARQVPVISCPVDADAANSNSVNVPLQKLADVLAWLQANAALPTMENGFTVEQAFLAASALLLSRSGPQTITKIGSGILQILNTVDDVVVQAAAGHNASLVSSGGASLTAGAAGLTANKPLAMGTNPITGVVDPTNDQDASTKHFAVGLDTANRSAWASAIARPSVVSAADTGHFAVPSGTESDIDNMHVTIATTGRPVCISMQEASTGGSYIGGMDVTATHDIGLSLWRDDGSGFAKIAAFTVSGGGPAVYPPAQFSFVDLTAAAGSHTYKYRASSGASGGFINNCNMVAYEIA